MSLRQQIELNNGVVYLTTYLDEIPLSTTFIGASPENLESTADALYETATNLRKASEAVESTEKPLIITDDT